MTTTTHQAADDPVVEANRQLLLDRSRVGIAKYGVSLGAAGLPREHLVQHALEEALDLANYLQAVLQQDRAARSRAESDTAPADYDHSESGHHD